MFLKLIELYKIYRLLYFHGIPKNHNPISINIIIITFGHIMSNDVYYLEITIGNLSQ